MVEEASNSLEEIGTAAHLMMEAVDKSTQELEFTVRASTEHLQAFYKSLSENFTNQLTRLADKALRAADRSSDELQARKEDFAERLAELEQAEINTLIQASKEVRQELNLSLQKAVGLISQLVEEQVKTMRPIALSQHESFSSLSKQEAESLQKSIEEDKGSLKEKEMKFEKDLAQRVKEFEREAKAILEENKQKLTDKIKSEQEKLSEKIGQAKNQLNQFVVDREAELQEKVNIGSASLTASGTHVSKRLVDEVDDWQLEMNRLAEDFEKLLGTNRDSFDKIYKAKIERQVQEVKDEIKTIVTEGQRRLSASDKLFHGSLRRLERKYYEPLQQLCTQFDAAVAQEGKLMAGTHISDVPSKTSHESKELLNTRLKARGLEIVKAFKRQVGVFDLEYVRFSASCNERIETVHSSADDLLDQQLKTMNTEIERMLRGFHVELSQLKLQLPQIKDAGHAAALAVMAYNRQARLSFDTD